MVSTEAEDFETFFRRTEPRLRPALFAALGAERGREATAEAFAWAWETWPKAQRLENPTGYLFRVGQSKTRRKRFRPMPVALSDEEPLVEPGKRLNVQALPGPREAMLTHHCNLYMP